MERLATLSLTALVLYMMIQLIDIAVCRRQGWHFSPLTSEKVIKIMILNSINANRSVFKGVHVVDL